MLPPPISPASSAATHSPVFGWAIGLADMMNTEFGDTWAFSGSFAMYLIAAANGKPGREPDDIDILCEKVSPVWLKLVLRMNGELDRPPGPYSTYARAKNIKLNVVSKTAVRKIALNVDVLAAGERFGSLEKRRVLELGPKYFPVVTVEALLTTKQKMAREGGLPEEQQAQIAKDIAFLKTLKDRGRPLEKKGKSPTALQMLDDW